MWQAGNAPFILFMDLDGFCAHDGWKVDWAAKHCSSGEGVFLAKINTINNPNFLEIENFWIYYLHKQKAMSIARELGISWYISWIDFIQFNLSQPEFFSQCRLTLSKNFLQFDILVHFCRTMWQVLLYIASFCSFGPENKIFPIHDILQKKIVYIKLKKIIILFSIFFLFQMAKTMAKIIIERVFSVTGKQLCL